MSLGTLCRGLKNPQAAKLLSYARAWETRFRPTNTRPFSGTTQNTPQTLTSKIGLLTPEEKWAAAADQFEGRRRKPADAYTGRSVRVIDGNINLANRQLNSILTRDGVMKEWFENRRHQQKGELRRKLRSMRWRKLFKHEVGKKVELVQQIRRRGA